LPFSFRLFHRYANFLFFFHYNTDFAIFDYLWDWFFADLSVPPVEDVAKISTNKLSTFDLFNFYFTTCFNPKQGPLQVSLHFEEIQYNTKN